MTPYTSFAQEIDKTKPDLKSFWANTMNSNISQQIYYLSDQPISALNVLKLELLSIYSITHSSIYMPQEAQSKICKYLSNNDIDISGISKAYTLYTGKVVPILNNFKVNGNLSQELILGNVTKPSKYLNSYLRGKLSSGDVVSSAYSKRLEPNPMSLAVFKHWLTTIKPLNSVQALAFINQVYKFPEPLKTNFFDAIMNHCPKPSIVLQEEIRSMNFNSSTYQCMPYRHLFRSLAQQKISFETIWDTRDSDYKPFTTNTVRPAPTRWQEVEDLLGSALVLLQQSDHSTELVDQLIQHALSAEKGLVTQYRNSLSAAHNALNILMEKFNGN